METVFVLHKLWKLVIFFSSLHYTAISKTSKFGMENFAAVVGQPTRVVCASNSTIKGSSLKFCPTGQEKEIQIWSQNDGLNDKLSIKPIIFTGNNNSIVEMIINSSINGTYICTVLSSGGNNGASTLRFSAQMIVLDGNLSCKGNFNDSTAVNEFDIVEVECRIGYTGNWAPVMQWRLNSEDGVIVGERNKTSIIRNDSVTSVLRLIAFRHLANAKCVCKVFFSAFIENISMRTIEATNIPTYNNTWTSPSLKFYAPTDPKAQMLYLAVGLGVICAILLFLNILISRKYGHNRWLSFCLKRKQTPKKYNLETNSTGGRTDSIVSHVSFRQQRRRTHPSEVDEGTLSAAESPKPSTSFHYAYEEFLPYDRTPPSTYTRIVLDERVRLPSDGETNVNNQIQLSSTGSEYEEVLVENRDDEIANTRIAISNHGVAECAYPYVNITLLRDGSINGQ